MWGRLTAALTMLMRMLQMLKELVELVHVLQQSDGQDATVIEALLEKSVELTTQKDAQMRRIFELENQLTEAMDHRRRLLARTWLDFLPWAAAQTGADLKVLTGGGGKGGAAPKAT